MGLFGPPDVARLEARRDVKGLIGALGYSKDGSVRRSAALALGRSGDTRAVGPLIAALEDPSTYAAQAAATALGEIGDARAVEPLIAATRGRDEALGRAAVGSLGVIGVPAVMPLIALLGTTDGTAREAAGEALALIGGPAVEPLVAALGGHTVGKPAAKALALIGVPAVEPLVVALTDPDDAVRRATAEVLGGIGDTRAVGPLIAALSDQDLFVRMAVAEALGVIGDTRAVEPLIAALSDRYGYVGADAASALDRLAWSPDRGAAGAAYWAARGDWDTCVQIGAPAVGPLVALLASESEFTLRDAAEALHQLGWSPDRDEAGATYWAVRGEWGKCVRVGAPAVGPLVGALTNWDPLVRRAAAKGLVSLYRSGALDDAQRARLLAQRDVITRSHEDQDHSGVVTCKGIDYRTGGHADEGIGVEFPL